MKKLILMTPVLPKMIEGMLKETPYYPFEGSIEDAKKKMSSFAKKNPLALYGATEIAVIEVKEMEIVETFEAPEPDVEALMDSLKGLLDIEIT